MTRRFEKEIQDIEPTFSFSLNEKTFQQFLQDGKIKLTNVMDKYYDAVLQMVDVESIRKNVLKLVSTRCLEQVPDISENFSKN